MARAQCTAEDYAHLEHYLTRADNGKFAGSDHPERKEAPIGKQGETKRVISTSARTNGTNILTPRKYANLLHAHDAPPGLLERTKQGWLFKDLRIGGELQNLEYRTFLLDNGEEHTQEWWHNDYRQTREGQESWRLPTTEEATEMFYRLLVLDKTHYHNDVQFILNGDQQNNIPGLLQNISRGPVLADHIQFGKGLTAIITNPYGKKETTIPIYQNNYNTLIRYLILAPRQHEGLLGVQTTPDEASWLETLVGEKWAQLPQILQFIAPRLQRRAPKSVGHEQESHLQEARIWTSDLSMRNSHPGRVASLEVDGEGTVNLCVVRHVDEDRWALGVRSAPKPS